MTVGFVALWKNNPREYVASRRDEWSTTEAIQAAFARGRERGNRTYGLYFLRWSSAWQYMTFWVSPGMSAVFETIADLERAGDFKFADSWHIFGEFIDDPAYLTGGAWDVVPEPVVGEAPPHGMFVMERGGGTGAVRHRDALPHPNPSPPQAPLHRRGESPCAQGEGLQRDVATEGGGDVLQYGAFDCRFSTGWDRFSFVTAPRAEALVEHLARRERGGELRGVETFAATGRLDRYFRFGNHLQTSLDWLNEEERG